MTRLTLRGLLAHKIRFALTTFAVVLGVAFVTGAFVLTDGLRATFDDLVSEVTANIDVEVRGEVEFDDGTGVTPPVPVDVVDTIAAVEGVDRVAGVVEANPGAVVPVAADGDAVQTLGPPILAFNWTGDLGPTSVTAGEAPDAPGEFVLDETTADDEGFVVGDTYDVIVPTGRVEATLVGTISFGAENALAGAVLTQWETGQLQELLDREGLFDSIDVSARDGVVPQELATAVTAALPDGFEAVGSEEVVEEQAGDFDTVIDIFGNILLGFAGVSLFVSAFIINNTFTIVLGQRVRELALLRAVGAAAAQVRRSVLGEALVVGLLASVLGLAGGFGLAIAIRALLNGFGFGLPPVQFGLAPRTVIAAFVIGLGVTLASAIAPARKTTSIPPVAAMRDGFVLGAGEGTRRVIAGAVLLFVGLAAMAWGVFGDPEGFSLLVAVAGGAVAVFVGVAMLSPLVASPVARVLGAALPRLPWLGPAGRLARENSARNSRRTAATASALMIGLALVAAATVLGTSLKQDFRDTLSSSVQADYFITDESFAGFSPELAASIEADPAFGAVTAFRFGRVRIDDDTKDVGAADLAELPQLIDVDVVEGDVADGAGGGGIALFTDPADDLGVGVGDTVPVAFADGRTEDLRVVAVYDDASILGNYTIDLATWDAHFPQNVDVFVAASLAADTDPAAARAGIDALAREFDATVEDRAEFQASQESQLDSLLAIINALLVFTILIALLGIVNTLALAVFERTREIGLLRAVGMSRRQARSMIRWEGAIVAAFGAILGTLVGVAFGWAAVRALPDSIVNTFAVPVPTLLGYIVVATLAALVAASIPAWRAGRLNVLDAISHL